MRGLGPMMAIELVRSRAGKEPLLPEATLRIVRDAVSNGVVVMRAGLYSNCIRLLPPLNMPEEMLREGLGALGQAVESAALDPAVVSA